MYKIISGIILLIMAVVGISIYTYSNKSEIEAKYQSSSEDATPLNDSAKQESESDKPEAAVSDETPVTQQEGDVPQVKEVHNVYQDISPEVVTQESGATIKTEPVTIPENKNLKTMEPQSFSIETNQSVTFGDLTITHLGGGHDMLVDGDGHDAGDSSYASFALETPRTPRLEVGFDDTSRVIEPFDSYVITIDSIGWEGNLIKFTVQNVAN